jgi:hypothetical protein
MKILNTYNYYLNFSAEQLLTDDFFISSIKHPTEETKTFWKEVLERRIVEEKEFELARYLLISMQIKREQMKADEVNELWENIEIRNKANLNYKRKKDHIIYSFFAAASILLAVGFTIFEKGYLLQQRNHISIENVQAPLVTSSNVQLMLGGNKSVPLKGDTVKVIYNGNQIQVNEKSAALSASNGNDQQGFNQLIVPYGKHSMLSLNDGTKVWVNAGSRVVYPVQFDSKLREIYIDGEAYLDVKHNERWPFVVKTNRMEVQVKGTSFNVMAYSKDADQQVVLVRGKVRIVEKGTRHKIDLHPNEMFIDDGVKTQVKAVDVDDYTLWTQGLYKYDSERLDVIMKRLSRYYNEVLNCNADVAFYKCSGKLDMNMSLEEVLKGISLTAPISFNKQNGRYLISHK